MSEFVAFLTARLDEDEYHARAACRAMESRTGDEWERWRGKHGLDSIVLSDNHTELAECHVRAAPHIARHDPARVLREVTAKRAILAKYLRAQAAYERMVNPASTAAVFALAEVVQHMATAWEDHPDFQEHRR